MRNNIILMDGATGTNLWQMAEEQDIPKIAVWHYNLEHPELVLKLQKEMVSIGTRLLMSNTFGANRIAVEKSPYTVKEVVSAGVKIALEAAKGHDVEVGMAAGQLTCLMTKPGKKPRPGRLTPEEVEDIYREMLTAGVEAGANSILLLTFMDLDMLKIAARIGKELGVRVYCSMTFEASGRTLMGNTVEQICNELGEIGVDAVGMNCSLGPDLAMPIIREFAEKTSLPLIFKPNAGMPKLSLDNVTSYDVTPEELAAQIRPALDFVTYLGGCCGTSLDHFRAIAKMVNE